MSGFSSSSLFLGTTEYLKAWGIPPKVMTFDTCKEYVCAVRPAPKRAPRATHPAQSRSKCHSLVVFCLCNQAFLFPFIGLGFVVVLCFLFSPFSLSLFISLCLHHPSPKQLNHLLGPRRIILVFYSSSRDSLINLVLGLTLSAATLRKVLRHMRRGFWRRASSDASTLCTHTHHELSSRQEGECEQNRQLPQFVGKAISLIIQKVGEISGAEFAFPPHK